MCQNLSRVGTKIVARVRCTLVKVVKINQIYRFTQNLVNCKNFKKWWGVKTRSKYRENSWFAINWWIYQKIRNYGQYHRYQKKSRLFKVCCVSATRATFLAFLSFFLLGPLTKLMKQTKQAVCAIKQFILLRCQWTPLKEPIRQQQLSSIL
jgi:hypothetical protein